ncbi:hypothetical protein H696_04882 [Fonticula alba]|uniref:N-acetyltransferase domain-containing protein n=1 Tax=Fonticula alba TaxID=691883 RepID=A0A058Z2W3_FONAL|nr:hypothetical protein H696_04882 [Fonticula alba]KCV68590.1 hypothetical protein H696_04882 [Fonticula alba]|eukprot:XP_009497022.1 hypothetical protein H696_04882 [Fonticula alba]
MRRTVNRVRPLKGTASTTTPVGLVARSIGGPGGQGGGALAVPAAEGDSSSGGSGFTSASEGPPEEVPDPLEREDSRVLDILLPPGSPVDRPHMHLSPSSELFGSPGSIPLDESDLPDAEPEPLSSMFSSSGRCLRPIRFFIQKSLDSDESFIIDEDPRISSSASSSLRLIGGSSSGSGSGASSDDEGPGDEDGGSLSDPGPARSPSQASLSSSSDIMDHIYIRPMEMRDIAACFHLGNRVFTRNRPNLYRLWDEYEVIGSFSGDTELCYIAEIDVEQGASMDTSSLEPGTRAMAKKKLVGFAFGNILLKKNHIKYGYLHWIAVDPEHQQRGIGSRLFERALEPMLEEGVSLVLCDTPDNNLAAIQFFRKLGFTDPIKHVFMSRHICDQEDCQHYRRTPSSATSSPESSNPPSQTGSANSSQGALSPRRPPAPRICPSPSLASVKTSAAGLIVREMTIDDLYGVYLLGEEVFGLSASPNMFRFWTESEVLDLFETDSDFCFVAELHGEIIGFCLGTTIQKSRSSWKYGYLIWLGVSSKARGLGVGKILAGRFEQSVLNDGALIMLIDTQSDAPAVNFWRKLNFGSEQNHVFMSMRISDSRSPTLPGTGPAGADPSGSTPSPRMFFST